MNDPGQQLSFHRKALWLIAGAFIFRVLYSLFFPVNLAGDEAYYWDWGRRPDIGYYSKPPFIAWLYAVVDWLGSGSLFGIRAAAIVLGTLSLLVVYFLTSDMFDRRTGYTAVLLALAAPAISVLSFFLTIDAPLVLFWSLSLWMLWRFATNRNPGSALFILFLALALGHLTKQMMMIFPILAIVFLSIGNDTRTLLKRPAFWLATMGSYLSLTPPLIWNSQNEWITFTHTKHHFQNAPSDKHFLLERIEKFFEFLATQLGVLSPVTTVVVFILALAGLAGLRKSPKAIRFLLVFCGIPLVGLLLLAMRQKLQPNWPAVFYIAGMILAAAWFCGQFSARFPPASWKKLYKPGLILGFCLTGFFYFGTFLFQLSGFQGHKADPNRRMYAHDRMGAEFQEIRESISGYEDMFVVGTGHRYLTSFLAFYQDDQPRTYRYEPFRQISSQYEMWPNPYEDGFAGKDGLILAPHSPNIDRRLEASFEKTELVGEFRVPYGYDRTHSFFVIRGIGLKSWPAGIPLPESAE